MNPHLLFEFVNENGQISNKHFINPIRIYQTEDISKVHDIFVAMEEEIANGYYVAGYISYEAAPAFEPKITVHPGPNMPLVWFGIFDEPLDDKQEDNILPYHVSNWSLDANFDKYQEGISQIKKAIKKGNTYQVNYTARLRADFEGDEFSFYKQLTKNQQSSYSAYLNIGKYRILSASPELFFQVNGNTLTTKPMKGTAKRGRFSSEDQAKKHHLLNSEKEIAENLMIVDLLRNDLGKIAKPGSVHVPKLFEIETYPTVHQMTSTVRAELEENKSIFEWFQALFPCGSITGAPKIRTMDYIAQLEQSPRDIYCGAIGYFTPHRNAVFNVPIRTVVIDIENKQAIYGVGGGITWDSTVTGEYDELFTKARLLTEQKEKFQLLESILLTNGTYPLKTYHLNRLRDSAQYFNFTIHEKIIEDTLAKHAEINPTGDFKVRLTLDENGELSLESIPVKPMKLPVPCSLAETPVNRENLYLFHKTTYRKHYEKHQESATEGSFSVLLWNEEEELTEFTFGNLVVEMNGNFYTPPITSGVLPGTRRQKLIDNGEITEKTLYKSDLSSFDRIWFINSVRGWLEVELI